MKTRYRLQMISNALRLILIVAVIAVQCWWLVWLVTVVQKYAPWIALLDHYVPFIMILYIYGKNTNSAFKMPWMILIATVPLFGVCMYLIFGHHNGTPAMRRRFGRIQERYSSCLPQDPATAEALARADESCRNQASYIYRNALYPAYQNTEVTFFDDTVPIFEDQLEAVRGAEHFIFLEYHAVQDRGEFVRLREILAEKAAQGVDVRLIYDDLGSFLFQYDRHFDREMAKLGIKCRRFNPMVPFLNIFMVNRDHRKITVIDGHTAYTGGYNIAEEYLHKTSPYGWWKDTGVKLRGPAVRSFTVMFLEMWNSIADTDSRETVQKILKADTGTWPAQSFVQPYADSPLDHVHTGEEVYMNIIRNARKYVWFSSPYLILTDDMMRELIAAAGRGIDVRIVVPGIPDKRVVYASTRAHCARLIRGGVKIFRYDPGFNHAKECVSDDGTAVVGTINMDFRSFYCHFENGVLLFGDDACLRVRDDLRQMMAESTQITREHLERNGVITQIWHTLLRLISPLL